MELSDRCVKMFKLTFIDILLHILKCKQPCDVHIINCFLWHCFSRTWSIPGFISLPLFFSSQAEISWLISTLAAHSTAHPWMAPMQGKSSKLLFLFYFVDSGLPASFMLDIRGSFWDKRKTSAYLLMLLKTFSVSAGISMSLSRHWMTWRLTCIRILRLLISFASWMIRNKKWSD